jgi:hypothetical protein
VRGGLIDMVRCCYKGRIKIYEEREREGNGVKRATIKTVFQYISKR